MVVHITDPEEWARVLTRRPQTSPLFVSSDAQWWRNDFGMLFVYAPGAIPWFVK